MRQATQTETLLLDFDWAKESNGLFIFYISTFTLGCPQLDHVWDHSHITSSLEGGGGVRE